MIRFWRLSDGADVGTLTLDGETATATGGAASLLEMARRRGQSDADTYRLHIDWSNGFVSSAEGERRSSLADPKSQRFEVVPKRETAEVAESMTGTETMAKLREAEQARRDARRSRRR